ncbi:MAG: hypothetical protein AB1446_10060 [Bacillota bacterium]
MYVQLQKLTAGEFTERWLRDCASHVLPGIQKEAALATDQILRAASPSAAL